MITLGGGIVNVPSSFSCRDANVTHGIFLSEGSKLVQAVTNADLVFETNGTGNFDFNNATTQTTV